MTFDRDKAITQIADDVAALVAPKTHIEPIYDWVGRNRKMVAAWRTDHPSLLEQLRRLADEPLVEEQGESGRSVPKSRAPGGEDALDRLITIEAQVTTWVQALRRDLRETVEENLRLLVGMARHLEDPKLWDLGRDTRRWEGWAATIAGWRTEPWRPHVPCPLCSKIGTLRVRLDEKRATCLGCSQYWSEDDGSISLLADYIREVTEDGEEAGASA